MEDNKTQMETTPKTTTTEVLAFEPPPVVTSVEVEPDKDTTPPPVVSYEVEIEKEDEKNMPTPIIRTEFETGKDGQKKEEVETATETTAVVEEGVSFVEVDDFTEVREKGEPSMTQFASFKEESNHIKDLNEREKKALDELKELVVAALAKHDFSMPRVEEDTKDATSEEAVPKKVAEQEATIEEESKKEALEEEETSKKEELKKGGEESKKEDEDHKEEGMPRKEEEVAIVKDEGASKKEEEEPKKEEGETKEEKEEPKKEELEETVKKLEEKEEEPKKEEDFVKKEEVSPIEVKPVNKEEEESEATAEPVKKEEPTKPEVSTEPCAPVEKVEKISMPLAAALAKEKEEEEEDNTKTAEATEETVIQVPEIDVEMASNEVLVDISVKEEKPPPPPEEVFIWGIPLIGNEQSDTLLLKFLRARDFKVKDTFTMIKNTVMWRKEFGIEELLNEDLGLSELEKVVFTHGLDKEGHPVWYNTYGAFQDKDLYQKAFGDEEKRRNFLRWIIQVLEKNIREKLDFSPGGICTLVQVTDLKNSALWKKELRQASKQAVALLQDNYPEMVAKQICINVSWWYLAYKTIVPLFTPRTKSKFVFSGPSRSTETLFKYIAPEQVPIQYGGLSAENDTEFCISDAVTNISIKPTTQRIIEIPVTETCTLVWELRVLGWDVSYGAEFVPDAESAYTVIIQKFRKFTASDEPVIKNNFRIGESGKVVITLDNATSKKRRLFYRYKTKTSTD